MKKFRLNQKNWITLIFFWSFFLLLVGGFSQVKGATRSSSIPKASKEYVYHIVKKGETLEKIARKYNLSIAELKRLNNLKRDKILVGQKLIVGVKKDETSTREKLKTTEKKEYVYHIVKKGESLDSIAKRYRVSKEELKRLNHLRSEILTPNQRLIIRPKEEDEDSYSSQPSKPLEEKETSFQALEKKFEGLKNSSKVSRKQWVRLAEEYKRFYLLYPNNPLAPKAVLRTAQAYYQAYTKSLRKSDLNQAVKNYQRLLTYYSNSAETEEAYYMLAKIYGEELSDKNLAERYKKELEQRFPKSAYLAQLKPLPQRSSPATQKEIAKKKKKKRETFEFYTSNRTAQEPKITLAPQVVPKRSETKVNAQPTPALVADAKRVLEVSPVTGEDYTRIIIGVSGNFEYQTNILKSPPRIYVDIYPANLDPKVPKEIELKDVHLQKVRVGQFDKNVVRVVVDLKSLTSYKIFKLKDPHQLVLDFTGEEKMPFTVIATKPKKSKSLSSKKKQTEDKQEYINLARQFGLGIKRIVIDPGHGGEDPGAVGPTGLKEKEVNLQVAKLLAQKLKERLPEVKVILTRNTDVFIPLIQRPAIANSKKGDIFISLHTNASPDPNARGIEVYYLNFSTDPESMRVAALENSASDKTLSDLQDLIKAVLSNTKLSESKLLAEKVNQYLHQTLVRFYPDTPSRGVKYAPFLVLVGTRMPAILVEVSFITNPVEESRLKNPHYLEMVAEGIAKGVEAYVQTLKLSQTFHGKTS
jgi:N-acetylmuramoyl-L-alanine amidase